MPRKRRALSAAPQSDRPKRLKDNPSGKVSPNGFVLGSVTLNINRKTLWENSRHFARYSLERHDRFVLVPGDDMQAAQEWHIVPEQTSKMKESLVPATDELEWAVKIHSAALQFIDSSRTVSPPFFVMEPRFLVDMAAVLAQYECSEEVCISFVTTFFDINETKLFRLRPCSILRIASYLKSTVLFNCTMPHALGKYAAFRHTWQDSEQDSNRVIGPFDEENLARLPPELQNYIREVAGPIQKDHEKGMRNIEKLFAKQTDFFVILVVHLIRKYIGEYCTADNGRIDLYSALKFMWELRKKDLLLHLSPDVSDLLFDVEEFIGHFWRGEDQGDYYTIKHGIPPPPWHG